MAIIKYWIQIENHPWDLSPSGNVDRMTGKKISGDKDSMTGKASEICRLISPETSISRNRKMNYPLKDALILRRYTENWEKPDDRKVNPWDINEPNPTDAGTMGTIPGPIIECNVGDTVEVHFRNKDFRFRPKIGGGTEDSILKIPHIDRRTHSLHPHGFVFDSKYDGAYPMSPPDESQPIDDKENRLWKSIGVEKFKKGDRVPPGGTFTYTWETHGWPTTAGVWLYHDHSICDTNNVDLGAIGIIVIHNEDDLDDVVKQDLPDGSPNGSVVVENCVRFPFDVPILPHDLDQSVIGLELEAEDEMPMLIETDEMAEGRHNITKKKNMKKDDTKNLMRVMSGNVVFEIDRNRDLVERICTSFYRDPPKNAVYLLLLHNLEGTGMCINGRKYLGNTPTVVAGTDTKMRFGIVGMGDTFHTFHLHGHRWIIPGPVGTTIPTDTIQNSVQKQAVSQFEDTRIFGPANSFAFTIHEGSFMGAGGSTGEFHMHCHVFSHMMTGMMGSLLVIKGGELAPPAKPLPSAEKERTKDCMDEGMGGMGGMDGNIVHLTKENQFFPRELEVKVGETVTWIWDADVEHNIVSDTDAWSSHGTDHLTANSRVDRTLSTPGIYDYHCGLHGTPGGFSKPGDMSGRIRVVK
jgi:plastocyanin/FtsP/CotA-like multicopper oxidase with cupredoxin domain